MPYVALAVMVHPLVTVIISFTSLFAVVRRIRGGALDGGEVDPFLTGIRLIRLICGWRSVFDVEGEVVPILAEGEEGGFHEVVENIKE